jgi:AraC-like DNA-binding protein/quercetin dioxygenase-like cupin family protein
MDATAANCVSIGQYTVRAGWVGTRHSHPFVEIITVLRGKLAIEIGNVAVTAEPGDVLLYPVHAPHAERATGDEPSEFYAIAIEADLHTDQVVTQDTTGRLRMLSKWLMEEQQQMERGKTAIMRAFMQAFVAEYLCALRRHRSELVEKVQTYLRGNLHQRLTVSQIAQHVNMSRAHFTRMYKRLTGRTPMEVLRILRVEAARDMIITTDKPLKCIAPQVGFCDQYQLSRVFRRLLHVTPGHFRRQFSSEKGLGR